jgi:hypothetical protein
MHTKTNQIPLLFAALGLSSPRGGWQHPGKSRVCCASVLALLALDSFVAAWRPGEKRLNSLVSLGSRSVVAFCREAAGYGSVVEFGLGS